MINGFKIVKTEDKDLIKQIERIDIKTEDLQVEYTHLIMDIDDGLATLYENGVMSNEELIDFIKRNDCLYICNEVRNTIKEYNLPFVFNTLIPKKILLKARALIIRKLDYYGLEIE